MASDGFRWLQMASDGFRWLLMAGTSAPLAQVTPCQVVATSARDGRGLDKLQLAIEAALLRMAIEARTRHGSNYDGTSMSALNIRR